MTHHVSFGGYVGVSKSGKFVIWEKYTHFSFYSEFNTHSNQTSSILNYCIKH